MRVAPVAASTALFAYCTDSSRGSTPLLSKKV
jgi:hypothetical protein